MPDLDTNEACSERDADFGSSSPCAADDLKFPVSFAQQRLWLLDRLLPARSVYVEPKVYRLAGALKVDALRSALDELVQRHESLRTRFGFEESGPVQVIAAQLHLELEVEDLTGLGAGEREDEARRRAQEEAQTPFDLEHAPLLRVRLLRVGEQEHWLLLTLHHIITDGWSSGVLSRELSELYAAHSRGEASGLPALPVQYADYAVWQREWLQGEVLEQQLAYWKPALAGLPALELPTDRRRPPIATFRGDEYAFEIESELARALRKLGQRERATLFMTLLAAFQVLLYRYSGQEDIAVGVPIAGRTRLELEALIGFFVNTLVLRGDLSGDPSFTEYLARVRSRALEAYAHQDLPFEKLVEELHPKRDLSRNPLFQVALMMRNIPAGDLELAGLSVELLASGMRESAKFDLWVGVDDRHSSLRVRAVYATDLFDRATIERMMGHWRVLLAGIVADPAQPISRLPLLAPDERRQLVEQWNATAVATPQRCAHELFEEQAGRTPHAVAVEIGEERMTYEELNARANQLAHYLRTLGIGSEARVGLCVERSLELVVGLLGIWKAGGVYVPLDPGYPAQRLAYLLEDSEATLLLTSAGVLSRLPLAAPRLCLDSDWEKVVQQPSSNPTAVARPCDLAYVIHTSGSTGTPKGVMIEHRSLVNHIAAMQRRFAPGRGDCVLQASPIGFDQSIWQMMVPLALGARVALLEPDAHRSADAVIEAVQRHRASILRIVPTMVAALARHPRLAQCATLRLVISAGDVLEPRVAAEFAARSDALVVNAYGPTEATFVSTSWACEGGADERRIPIGAPIDNARTYILDRHDEPVPIGVVGHLCIGGAGVGRGYWKRPELTASSFVPDPHAAGPRGRMYRTGDLALRRADGAVEFRGRGDRQIKLRGIRIELGEIEAALTQHPDVADAVAVVRDDDAGDRRLVGYFVACSNPAPTAHALREFLKAVLPEHAIPAAFVELPRLPLTPHGKVDRTRLPEPDEQSLAIDPRFVAPRNDIEARLAAIFAESLSVDRVGVHDDFFALGGHSLLAMRVLSAMKSAFGVTISPRAFFADATIAGIAPALDADAPDTGAPGSILDRPGNGETTIRQRPRNAALRRSGLRREIP